MPILTLVLILAFTFTLLTFYFNVVISKHEKDKIRVTESPVTPKMKLCDNCLWLDIVNYLKMQNMLLKEKIT